MARIIVIDDERDVRDALQVTLASAGHVVRTAADGPSGIAACESEAPDLVLTDLVMPQVHGFDVIARLREIAPACRIVAISGGGNLASGGYEPESVKTNAYLAAALELGADAVLKKPFNRRELLDVIELCLASSEPATGR